MGERREIKRWNSKLICSTFTVCQTLRDCIVQWGDQKLCAKRGKRTRALELTSGPHLFGGPGRLLIFELTSEVVKLWVLAREGGWRKGCLV